MLPLLRWVRITFEQVCYVARCSPYVFFVLEISPQFYFEIPFAIGLDTFMKIASTVFIHT